MCATVNGGREGCRTFASSMEVHGSPLPLTTAVAAGERDPE